MLIIFLQSFGLPGLLCTLGTMSQREEPVELYGPVGLRHFVCANLGLSRADFSFNFIVHEMLTLPVQAPDNEEASEQIHIFLKI